MIYFYWQLDLDIHSSNIYYSEYIWIFSVPKKFFFKWILLGQNGLIWVQNNTKYQNVQNSPKQSWEYNLIFEYIQIFWTNIFICQNFCSFFLGQIYLDIHSWYFYHAKYIRIIICPISMVMIIFGYSFVQKNDISPTLLYMSDNKILAMAAVLSDEGLR